MSSNPQQLTPGHLGAIAVAVDAASAMESHTPEIPTPVPPNDVVTGGKRDRSGNLTTMWSRGPGAAFSNGASGEHSVDARGRSASESQSQDIEMQSGAGAITSPVVVEKRSRSMWARPGASDKRDLCYQAAMQRAAKSIPS